MEKKSENKKIGEKSKWKVATIVIFILSVIMIISLSSVYLFNASSPDTEPMLMKSTKISGWYDVPESLIYECNHWGGTTSPTNVAMPEERPPLSKVTATAQCYYTNYTTNYSKEYGYEVAWYVGSIDGASSSIYLKANETLIAVPKTYDNGKESRGYVTYNSSYFYPKCVLEYNESDSSNKLTYPVIQR